MYTVDELKIILDSNDNDSVQPSGKVTIIDEYTGAFVNEFNVDYTEYGDIQIIINTEKFI